MMDRLFKWGVFGLTMVLGLAMLTTTACLNDDLLEDEDAFPVFSADTIAFDTVFTTLGSTTELLLLRNLFGSRMEIDRIYLAGGESSNFRMNIDGISTADATGVEIAAEDSIYLFVEVTIDPNDDQLPFLVEDSIIVEYGDYRGSVLLEAFGQNAVFIDQADICDETWTDELPYVITDIVYVGPGCSLTIEEGVDVYVRRGARMIFEGNLQVNGKVDSTVSFQGLRLESFFDDQAGQWTGIELLRQSTATVNHAIVRNADYGFVLGSLFGEGITINDFTFENRPVLNLKNTIVRNHLVSGVLGFLSEVNMENCLIHDCGRNAVEMTYGGIYNMVNCSFANYGTTQLHRDPVLFLANAIEVDDGEGGVIYSAQGLVDIVNCLVVGSIDNEVAIQDSIPDVALLDYSFDNCILKSGLENDPEFYTDCLFNPTGMDTLFVDRNAFDYRLNDDSPAINAGRTGPEVPSTDLEGKARDGEPDIGAYEF